MAELIKGSFCSSKAGHDSGTVYVVVGNRDGIYVCDGRRRLLSNPKKKNPAHLQPISYRDEELIGRLEAGNVRDEDIKLSIKNYLIHSKKQDAAEQE
ncbi:MAG: KOW domain-containing RNA-binding protein [Butyrivibrio sp.]|nr:KOW domain-containing RNA-binding protein [Butyrivibrio sp.]